MKKTIVAFLAASMVSAAPFAAFAQENMDHDLSMLEQSVQNSFAKLGITEYKMEDLTLGQLAEIKSITGSNDYSTSEKQKQIMQVIERSKT
jgi:hypothetical protein